MRYMERQKVSFNWGLMVALIMNFSMLALFIIVAWAIFRWLIQ